MYLFILVFFLIGFFLRAQETISGNFLFLLDSGRDMMDVKKIVFDHTLTLIGPYTSLGGVFQGPLYYYLLSVPTCIFQGNPLGNILLMLLLSMSVVIFAYYFMNRYFGYIAAGITFTLFIFSPEAIAAATYFWNPHPMWILILIYIFAIYGALLDDKRMQLIVFPIIFLSFHFEMAFGVFLLISTVLFLLIFNTKLLLHCKRIQFGFLLGCLFLLPQIVFDLRHDFLMTRSIIKLLLGSNQGLTALGEYRGFVSVSQGNAGVFIGNLLSSFPRVNGFQAFPEFVFLLTAGVLLYAIHAKIFAKKELLFIYKISTLGVIIFILCYLYPFPLRYWFLTGFQTFYLVLTGLILSKLYRFKIGKIILVCLLGIYISYGVQRLDMLYIHPPDNGGTAKIQGKIQAIDYIYQDANNEEFGVKVFTPPVLTDAYDYLLWWYGKKKYGYLPHSTMMGTVYLLIEPDSTKPWSYQGWLDTVIKTGMIEFTKTLPSGFIIQKRHIGI